MQYFLTAIILLCALGYAAWRINDIFRKGGDPCNGCELREKCQKNSHNCGQNNCHCK